VGKSASLATSDDFVSELETDLAYRAVLFLSVFVAAIPLALLASILVISQREVHAVFPRHASSSGPR
jgi:hypothetical protein